MQKEYRAEAAKLKLPPGVVFPGKAVSGGGGGTFQQGGGLSDAQSYWRFAWETDWLEQRNKDGSLAGFERFHAHNDEAILAGF